MLGQRDLMLPCSSIYRGMYCISTFVVISSDAFNRIVLYVSLEPNAGAKMSKDKISLKYMVGWLAIVYFISKML
uniref:Uncharacterized protein n=1 Tax=Setaria italica TaxID=4555 RepID=K4A4J2_SETIT